MPQVDVQWPSEDENKVGGNEKTSQRNTGRPETVKGAQPNYGSSPTAQPSQNNTAAAAVTRNFTTPASSPATATNQISTNTSKKGSSMFKSNKSKPRLILEGVLVVLVVGLGIWAVSLYHDKKDLQNQVSTLKITSQTSAQKQTQQLVNEVGKLMQLPTSETPSIVTVSDAAQAKKNSAFFDNAMNGDKVLLYVKAGEAILYRPSTNKIILVDPISYNSATAPSTSNSAATTK
jgi:hypothetical protein